MRRVSRSPAPPFDEAKGRAFLDAMRAGDRFEAALRLARLNEPTVKRWLQRGAPPRVLETGKVPDPSDPTTAPYTRFQQEFARIVIARVQALAE